MKPFEAVGISKPLGAWTIEEVRLAASEAPTDRNGQSWVAMMRDEMEHFDAARVGDLSWQAVVAYGVALRLFESEQAMFAYVDSMLVS